MARPRKKILQKDISRNSSIKITGTINKIKANERKYTICLVIIFMTLFTVIGYFTLKINVTKYDEYLKRGSITLYSKVVALDEKQMETLKELQIRAKENGVETKLLNREELLKEEPQLTDEVVGGLLAPTAGIIDPFNLCVHLMENAIDNGVKLVINEEVTSIKKENGENITFSAQLDIAACFDSDASIYSHLLGKSNYEYIKRNPSPNSSPVNKDERLNKAIELVRKLHQRNYITIPSIDEDIELKGNKKINVSTGNATNLVNLTLGERTGACMRIGGAGESLFEFCSTVWARRFL